VWIRINWFPDAYPQFEKADFGSKHATLLINIFTAAKDWLIPYREPALAN
jgi:hypothetical protein